ncbi:MAG: hypothetical protein A2754_01325 [Candidatus Magasanikbacteria bacterium RIFCSPHIGHO2_01_FULL_47_8]|uniref:Uncharacterized protein n=1 Tax=Candidatus Magasanikbacteria bacterium RIFCSPHIGHO2_01_FULL_47_8 TaxID=1798673 RepID=A0A1F6MBD9_9BACT|nr:MAG: hypothetical protein A2754_01325 [Candidatus Magasanikbacteria bacterium RIFCSPHIGHO2_01_FULL_47_8]
MPRPRTRQPKRLTHEQFVVHAVRTLRNPQKSPGIHVVFDGFNEAFRTYFGRDDDPVKAIDDLVKEKKIVKTPARKGVMIYLYDELPERVHLDKNGNLLDLGTYALMRMGVMDEDRNIISPDLTSEHFTMRAIESLRDIEKSKGIHTVYSGFNDAFRTYFSLSRKDKGPIIFVDALCAEERVVRVFRKGGAAIFIPGEEPDYAKRQAQAYARVVNTHGMRTLKRMGLSEHPDP